MTLDDRLRTVLEVAADSDDAARAQYRQLVDLLGCGKTVADGTLTAAAFLRLAALARRIPAPERARILGDPALRLRSPPLVAQLCEGDARVAHAAIDAAELDDSGWTVLASVLDDNLQERVRSARMASRARRSEDQPPLLAKRKPKSKPVLDDLTPGALADKEQPRETVSDIAEIVARIERFRVQRRERVTEEALGREPADDTLELNSSQEIVEPPATFAANEVDCAISPDGRIDWADRHAPMLTGLILSPGGHAAARVDEATATALRRQQAVRGGKVTITASPVVSGEWRLDAAPDFDPVGRFHGHHARLTRHAGAVVADPHGDMVRQALHELRTPINALQGFSEIIQQQLFGPVPHQYRALAAGIAGESAALLAAMEEVDRLVRLRRGTRKLDEGQTAIGPLIAGLVDQFEPQLAAHGAHFAGDWHDPAVVVPVGHADLERSIWRLLAIVAGAAGDGEAVRLDLMATNELVTLSVALPAALAGLNDDDLYSASAGQDDADGFTVSLLGRGFALRLIRAEARAAGGSMERRGDRFVLSLPCEDDGSAGSAEAAEAAA